MGCCSSAVDAVDSSKTAEGRGEALVVPFVLKMPKVREAFRLVEQPYTAEVGSTAKACSKEQARRVLAALGFESADKALDKLWEAADKRDELVFKKLAAGVGKIALEDAASFKGKALEPALEGFVVVQQMFKKLDNDDSGEIDHTEMKAALTSFTRDKSIVRARMREMDLDGNKSVDFTEFLAAFATWAGWEENEQEATGSTEAHAPPAAKPAAAADTTAAAETTTPGQPAAEGAAPEAAKSADASADAATDAAPAAETTA